MSELLQVAPHRPITDEHQLARAHRVHLCERLHQIVKPLHMDKTHHASDNERIGRNGQIRAYLLAIRTPLIGADLQNWHAVQHRRER